RLDLTTELLVLALDQLPPAQQIDRTMLCGGHEPRARLLRDAGLWPPLERGDERLLREVLRHAHVADDPREAGDEPGGFDPPDGVDRRVRIGSGHGDRSQQLPPLVQDHGARVRSELEPLAGGDWPQSLPSQQGPISRTSTVAHSVAGHSLAIATASSLV